MSSAASCGTAACPGKPNEGRLPAGKPTPDGRSGLGKPLSPQATAASGESTAGEAALENEDAVLRDLMVRYQAADSEAVEALVMRLSPRLLRYLAGNLNTRGEAEDLLQICWMQVHRSRHTYRSSEPVLPWIFAIARHVRLDGFRRRRRLDSREVLADRIPERGAPGNAEAAVMEKQFFGVLDHLPESQREVIHMLKVTGMSLEEVARATSSTVGAVKQKAHRAYEKLRVILAKQ